MSNHSRIVNRSQTLGRVLVAAALFTGGCSLANASPPATTARATDLEGLKRAERTWVESLQTGDARRLATIIDSPFTFIGPEGELETRDAYLAGYEAMPKLGVVVERIEMNEVEFRLLGDVGIVTGRVLARVKMQGAPLEENVRFTRVYRRSPQGWQMVAGQGTRITPAPPAKG